GMGLHGTPSFLRWRNRELLYRIGVRLGGQPTFLTLRSDVSARALAVLGRRFSHHRPHAAAVDIAREGGGRLRFACRSSDGAGDAALDIDASAPLDPAPGSLFADADAAARFLVGMRFSADLAAG